MDYPKSVPGVGLVEGRFVNEDPIAGRPGSLIPAEWGNGVTDELLAVVQAGGIEPDEGDPGQVLRAISKLLADAVKGRPLVYSISALPDEDVGPVVVQECGEVWIWSESVYFTGYRSPLCGRPADGHTLAPLASEVDAVGGLLPKLAYARLWGYARENGLVVSQSFWDANKGGHYFVDVDANMFRVPDLRDMFRRFTGTDADTANARLLGSRQVDASQKITGRIQSRAAISAFGALIGATGAFQLHGKTEGTNSAPVTLDGNITNGDAASFDTSRVVRTSTENRSVNGAYHPRIHA
ncbi:phage tail protein [Achromobacter xylosoxidans]|uniref:phage tail protein n=1 Tax=Alcaligenes xylosoxydans xylosoxydans TaxID=85698 RepID=UPI001F13A6EB|nr:phage tail protein [Achromobacter xylosoxidans]